MLWGKEWLQWHQAGALADLLVVDQLVDLVEAAAVERLGGHTAMARTGYLGSTVAVEAHTGSTGAVGSRGRAEGA